MDTTYYTDEESNLERTSDQDYKDDNHDNDHGDDSPSKAPKFYTTMKYENFYDIIKLYPCLFNKSQTPRNNMFKQHAVEEVKLRIQEVYGINLSSSQIRKKLENMKMRVKAKRDKKQMGDESVKYKSFEEELLRLIDLKSESFTNLTDSGEHCNISAESNKYLEYESANEDKLNSSTLKSSDNNIPGSEMKSEANESFQSESMVIDEQNSKDTDSDNSQQNQLDKIKERTPTKVGFGIKEKDFFDIIKSHGWLFEKSQAPHVKVIKQDALQEIKKKIKAIHGITLKSSQIRKKLNNMKGRVKVKFYKSLKRNLPRYQLKNYERELLELMKFKRLPDDEIESSSDDSAEVLSFERNKFEPTAGPSSSSPKLNISTPNTSRANESNEFDRVSVFAMQKEALLEQKELNRQQNELNSLHREVLALKKEKLLLEIDLLRRQEQN